MKIKNIKYILFLAAALGMQSCLDLDPQDQLGGDKMWTKASDYQQLLYLDYHIWLNLQ